MDTVSNCILDALGGTTAVARESETPISTVHSWRKNGIPRGRLAHLRLIGQQAIPPVDVDAIVASHGKACASPGKEREVSGEVRA